MIFLVPGKSELLFYVNVVIFLLESNCPLGFPFCTDNPKAKSHQCLLNIAHRVVVSVRAADFAFQTR